MHLNITLNLTLNLWWNQDVNVDLSMLKFVPLSRYSTVLRALLCDDEMVMQPTMISLPTLQTLLLSLLSLFLLLLSLTSSPLSKISLFFLITSYLNRHFIATSASLRIEDRAFTQPLCSQAIHRL